MPPIRAEQVGSLLRPPELLAARRSDGDERLRVIEDRCILDALGKQKETGIDIFTDGEMRRGSWLSDMAEAVDGFVSDRVVLDWKGPGAKSEPSTALAAGAKLVKRRRLTENELPVLKASAQPFKITVPAASNFLVSSYKEGISDKAYASRAELLDDLVGIIRDEVEWLHSEGVPYIQLDAPYYSYYFDPSCRERLRDPDRQLEEAIRGDNATFAGLPRENLTLAVHVCRGNSRSRWYTEGGYDVIAEKLFGALDVDRFLLEYDSERSGGFEPLRLMPRGKTVVLGLITSKSPELESPDELRRRVDEAAKYVPLENLAISPQCGFASVAAGNLLTMDQQWRKLALVAETARKIWG
jgi:5-methyltetrahydropteroyltriglutamate--homocysteine methyltransferase